MAAGEVKSDGDLAKGRRGDLVKGRFGDLARGRLGDLAKLGKGRERYKPILLHQIIHRSFPRTA